MATKYTKERLAPIVANSVSIAEVMRKLQIKWSGGQQENIKRWIIRYEFDTSHFLGMSVNCGKNHCGGPDKKHWQEILVLTESDKREKSWRLRRALIESGIEYVCKECGQGDEWRGKKLILQVNHKNGNWKDNRPENTEFLCPNCHCVTEGWSGNNGLTGVTSIAEGDRIRRKRKKLSGRVDDKS